MDAARLERAFADYAARVEEIRTSGDWSRFADLFTLDAEYVEHALGSFNGREAIAAWAVKTMATYPGNVMTGFPAAWHVVDPAGRRVICEIRNLMPDLGDGVVREASNITILTLDEAQGDSGDTALWSREEDVYNPQKFLDLALDWARAAREKDVLPDDAAAFLKAFEK